MFQVVLFILSVALASVNGWGARCNDFTAIINNNYPCDEGNKLRPNYEQTIANTCANTATQPGGLVYTNCGVASGREAIVNNCGYCPNPSWGSAAWVSYTCCEDECGRDSVLYYAECINAGNTWDSDSCKCKETSRDTTITYCLNISMTSTTDVVGAGGLTYQQITKQPAHEIRVCHCKVKNGSITECEGKTGNIDVGSDCPVSERTLGTCNDSGKPDGPQPDNSGGNTNPAFVPANCFAVTGSTCHMTRPSTSETWTCDCDGSCDYAMNQYLTGGGDCYKPRSSSSYSPFSSSSRSSSSTSNPESSSTDNPQSSGSGGGGESGIYMDVLQAIQANTYGTMQNTYDISQWTQTTMNNTTDIKNELSNIGIDISHIRDNTLEIANNTGTIANNTGTISNHTGNIDNKLNTTNSLLNDIKNKNWNPTINVDVPKDTNIINVAGDTNIINVNVEGATGDTAHAPFEILRFLKGLFSDTTNNYKESDTLGSGGEYQNLRDSIIFKTSGDTIPNMKDSIKGAVTSVKGSLNALRDTINNSAFGDSLRHWESLINNNGVLSGSGSASCPSAFTRAVTWNMGGKLGTWNLGTFKYICEPIGTFGITLWALARMLLRAMVAISCMIWLYMEVAGVRKDED